MPRLRIYDTRREETIDPPALAEADRDQYPSSNSAQKFPVGYGDQDDNSNSQLPVRHFVLKLLATGPDAAVDRP